MRDEIGLGHHSKFFSRSSGSDLVYKISRSDLDSALYHMHQYCKVSDPDQSMVQLRCNFMLVGSALLSTSI